jgi:hypothetical protein
VPVFFSLSTRDNKEFALRCRVFFTDLLVFSNDEGTPQQRGFNTLSGYFYSTRVGFKPSPSVFGRAAGAKGAPTFFFYQRNEKGETPCCCVFCSFSTARRGLLFVFTGKEGLDPPRHVGWLFPTARRGLALLAVFSVHFQRREGIIPTDTPPHFSTTRGTPFSSSGTSPPPLPRTKRETEDSVTTTLPLVLQNGLPDDPFLA